MLSKKLWEARQVIAAADAEVSKRLLDVWMVEARQCFIVGEVSMVYSVLPWEDYGHLGTGVTLLYTAQLFGSSQERDKCRAVVKVTEEELEQLVRLGCRMLETERLPPVTPEVRKLIDRIVSSPYFNEEHPGSLVLDRLDEMVSREHLDMLKALREELQGIYTPTEDRSVFGYLSWELVKPGALTSLGNRDVGRTHARAIAEGVINVAKKVRVLKDCWPVCLREMNSSRFVKDLLTTRPPKSTVPHSHALLDCIEHTWLWMITSDMNVYSTLHGSTYSNLSSCDEALMYARFDKDVLPREVEKTQRRMAIEAFLAGAAEPKAGTSDDPEVLAGFEAMKKWYVSRGFKESCFPAEWVAWAARDPQDMDERSRRNLWLWDYGFRCVHLHPELLRLGGVDDEEVVEEEAAETEQLDEMSPLNFENRRTNFVVPERISPSDLDSHMYAADLVILPGPPHKIRRASKKEASQSSKHEPGYLIPL